MVRITSSGCGFDLSLTSRGDAGAEGPSLLPDLAETPFDARQFVGV
jgi:hypothetical protein